MVQQALSGLKVIEYDHLVAGAYFAKVLADLGVEVIRIGESGILDEARREGPFLNDVTSPGAECFLC